MPNINTRDFTLQAPRGRTAISACYELEGLTSLLAQMANEVESLDTEVVRGLALRARELSQTLLAIVSDDVEDAHASMVVFGRVMPEFVRRPTPTE